MKTIIQEGNEYISMKQIPFPMDKRKNATAIHLTGSLNSVCSIRSPLPPLPRRASASACRMPYRNNHCQNGPKAGPAK